MATSGALKWHGGKQYLARRIISLMLPHLHYIEPYFGGGAVLFARNPENVSEVVNDVNLDLTNFWCVLQGSDSFRAFQRLCEATPFSEVEWRENRRELDEWPVPDEMVSDRVVRAWRFFVCCRQSLAGRMKSFTGITRTRTRRGMNNEVSAWLSAVEGLPAVHERLRRVLILNRDALDVIRGQDGPDTFFYLDPPYLHETRTTTNGYACEMTADQHAALLDLLAGLEGKFILSGYRSALYDVVAEKAGWRRIDVEIANHAAGGESKRRMTECLWLNYAHPEAQP